MTPKRKRESVSESQSEIQRVSRSPKRPKFEFKNKTKEAKIRIGPEYQAVIPDLVVLPASSAVAPCADEPLDKESLMWAPTDSISEKKLNEYVLLSKEKYGHTREQAMSVLYRNDYDLENAINDLPNVKHLPVDEWTPDDNAVFESAYKQFGKNLSSIKYMMPHKPIGSLVKHYYLWKRNKHMDSVIDLKDLQGESSLIGPHHGEMPYKPITPVAKYYDLWKFKTLKRFKNCSVGKQSQTFGSAGPDQKS